MSEWKFIHDESLAASKNVAIWAKVDRDDNHHVLFERNDDGLFISLYRTAFDAVNGTRAIADFCYGWHTIICDENEGGTDPFLDRVDDVSSDLKALICDHIGSCEDMMHVGQVLLQNEECDGCEFCDRYLTNGKGTITPKVAETP